jgi:Domain of unknown function (DUF5667)
VITSRRAERFDELVEEGSTGGARLAAYADLLDVVAGLRAVEAPVPDPAFVATLRERLVAEAETVLARAAAERDETDARLRLPPATPRTQRRRRRLAAAVSGAVLVGTTATVAVAAQSALPGDGLYPVKRGLESAHAELTFDRAARGRVLLDNAGTRLDETQQLSRERADPSRVSEALDAFTQQATAGADLLVADYQTTGDESSMTTLRTFTASSMARLQGLQSVVPPQSLGDLLQAARALDQVQQISVHTCSGCAGPLATSAPAVLTQAAQAAADSWQVVVPRPRHHANAPRHDGQPRLPHVPAHLPPASVTDPGQSTATDPDLPTDGEVQHTLQHLTDGLTGGRQNDVASTVTDTTDNLLDAVGQAGNQVAGTVGGTVGGVTSLLPSGLPSGLPTLP